tara:strand:+ start:1781 stop:2521 length:741 start_codon:yes stop_codon:yes gene_type:complete
MTLQEVFDQLTYGELAQLNIGGAGTGVINGTNYTRVLSHVSLGLTSLYKRFALKEGRLIVQLDPSISTYSLSGKFAATNTRSREPIKYLLDSAMQPFQDDLLKVEQVLTDLGFEMAVNDRSNPLSVMTPAATTLRVPLPVVLRSKDLPEQLKTETLEVVYRANHFKIAAEDVDPEMVLLELPDAYQEALLYFVASRVNNPIGMSNEFDASSNYSVKYEQACQQLELQNLQVDQGSAGNKLYDRGWV